MHQSFLTTTAVNILQVNFLGGKSLKVDLGKNIIGFFV